MFYHDILYPCYDKYEPSTLRHKPCCPDTEMVVSSKISAASQSLGTVCACEGIIDGCSATYSPRCASCDIPCTQTVSPTKDLDIPFCRLSTHRLWHRPAFSQVAHVPTHPLLHRRTHATGPAWPEQSQVLRSKRWQLWRRWCCCGDVDVKCSSVLPRHFTEGILKVLPQTYLGWVILSYLKKKYAQVLWFCYEDWCCRILEAGLESSGDKSFRPSLRYCPKP